jgi:hypothetical protein
MRAHEFIAQTPDINHGVNYLNVVLLAEAEYHNTTLHEQLSDADIEYLKSLKSFSVKPVPGKSYIPVMIVLMPDQHIIAHGHPEGAEFLEAVPEGNLTICRFRTLSGDIIRYPDHRLTALSYTQLYVFDHAHNYNKFRSALALKFNQSLPDSELISEQHIPTTDQNRQVVKKYVPWIAQQLGLKSLPKIICLSQPEGASFGGYEPDSGTIKLVTGGRHLVDILRTLAHELVHYHQHQTGQELDGDTGSDTENEANARAGIIMRDFAQKHPDALGSE